MALISTLFSSFLTAAVAQVDHDEARRTAVAAVQSSGLDPRPETLTTSRTRIYN